MNTETLQLPMTAAEPKTRSTYKLFARPELSALLVISGLLFLWGLSKNGMANDYYAATVQSMASSWHNFLYGSFDMSGVMTVDKPPLAFWVQALSVKIFGYGTLAMLVPQALMGVASVALTYDIVDRRWGRYPALISGAVLALTPMAVAIFRHNNPDALLMLLSVAALWFVIRALEDGRTKWLLFAGAAIGAAFTTKMGAALLVIPALGAAYLWSAPVTRKRALVQLLAGGGVFIAVAAAWPLLMALTPAASRPWISGTTDNSIWSLIVEYNGLGRLNGQMGGPGGGNGGGPGGGVFGGEAGLTRLFNSAMGAQVAWLFGFAAIGGIAIALVSKLRPSDARSGWLVAVGGIFVTCAVAFSFAKGIFHPYYTAQLAPFTAALVGGGVGVFWSRKSADLNDLGWLNAESIRWLAAGAIIAGVFSELVVLKTASTMNMDAWQLVMALLCASAAAVVILAQDAKVRNVALSSAIAILLVAPAAWSVATLGHATSSTFPSGGPSEASGMGGPGGGPGRGTNGGMRGGGMGGPGGNSQSLQSAVTYAAANGGGTIGVESQSAAASLIAQSGADVAGIGGFSGRESSVSVAWLAEAVNDGRLRWIVTGNDARSMPSDGREGSASAMAAVAEVCAEVELTSTQTKSTSTESTSGFYDCQGRADELAAMAS